MDNQIIQQFSEMPTAIGEVIPPMTFFKFKNRTQYNGKGYKVKVKCPYGSRKHYHIHGWGENNLPDDPEQTRQAHCHGGEYRIVIDGGQK